MSLETPPAPPQEDATRACPRCGAPLTPDQEWCLKCGADVGARVAPTPRWKVPVVLVGVLIALALGAVALALVELADDDQQAAQAPTAQPATPTPTPPPAPAGEQPAPGEQGAPSGTPVPEASDNGTATGQSGTANPPESEGQTGSSSPNSGSGSGSTGSSTPNTGSGSGSTGSSTPNTGTGTGSATIAEWPAGKTAWTVILESATSKSAADQKAQELSSGGTSVGVLHSDDYSSLKEGYWVVFSGQYDSQSAAESALPGLKSKVSEAYVRHVVPRSA